MITVEYSYVDPRSPWDDMPTRPWVADPELLSASLRTAPDPFVVAANAALVRDVEAFLARLDEEKTQ